MKKSVLIVVFILPAIFVVVLYFLFSVKTDLIIDTKEINNETDIKFLINDTLLKQEQKLEFLASIINPNWFLYSVSIKNLVRLAIVSDTADPPYSEYQTLLTLITDKKIPVLWGENKTVSTNIKRAEILNRFSQYTFSFAGDPKQVFGPSSDVKIQHSPSLGSATFKITLSRWSLLLIYIFSLISWCGLLILARPIFQFIYSGRKWWLKE